MESNAWSLRLDSTIFKPATHLVNSKPTFDQFKTMDQRTKNKRNYLPNITKEVTPDQHSWPNLPHQLLCLIARKPTLMQNITSFGGVIKSWRSAPQHCRINEKSQWPKLVEIDTKGSSKDHTKMRSHVIEIPFHEDYPYPYYKGRTHNKWYPGKYFKGHSHGQLVAFGSNISECFLWEPARGCSRYLPDWNPKLPFKMATLSSQPDFPNKFSMLVVTGVSSPSFAFYRAHNGERVWITETFTLKDPYAPQETMQFTNAIGFKGKFYALSLQGSLVVIEDVGSSFKITGVSASRTVPFKVSRQYREFLVEVDGEILLVFLVSRKSIDVVEDVEVFRLDVVKLLWVKVESLGERTLFLEDECCMWVDARKVGCKKNCIYFTHDRVDKWWAFDMENGSIVPVSGSGTEITKFEKWNEPMELE